MKTAVSLATVVALALAACSTTTAPVQNTTQAEMNCRNFVALEGLTVGQLGKAEAADGGFRVPVRVEDKLGRRIDTACVITGTQTRWANPLPTGLALR